VLDISFDETVLKATQIGGRGRVLIAGVDEDRTRSVFGDVVEKVPTGEEDDACGGEGEFAPEKFEDSFVGLLDRIVAFDNVIRGASGKDFGIARVGDVVDVGDANVGDDEPFLAIVVQKKGARVSRVA